MTHDELLAKMAKTPIDLKGTVTMYEALVAVVKLHEPEMYEGRFSTYLVCHKCVDEGGYTEPYPCPTIQVIKKEFN